MTLEALLPSPPRENMPYAGTSRCVRAIRPSAEDRIFAGGWEAGAGDVTLGYTLYDAHFYDQANGVGALTHGLDPHTLCPDPDSSTHATPHK